MTTINVGRIEHLRGLEAAAEVLRCTRIFHVISDECAVTVASWFQGPAPLDMPFTLLSQGSPVDAQELIEAIEREQDSTEYDAQTQYALRELLIWTVEKASGEPAYPDDAS